MLKRLYLKAFLQSEVMNDDGINFNPKGRCAPGHHCKRGHATTLKNQLLPEK